MGNSCSTEQDCQWNSPEGVAVPFEADPDIAGIGVIVAFFVSAWLTFFIALFSWHCVDGVMEEGRIGVARIDLKIHRRLKKLDGTTSDNALSYTRFRITKEQMQQVCLMFADQQLVTGTAILIISYMEHCAITQYHFYIVANLTLMSFSTYQSVLLIVHDVLQTNVRRVWRTVWIAILYLSVLPVKFIIYNDNFLGANRFGLSMDCFWKQLPNGYSPPTIPYIVIGILIDLYSGCFVLYCLWPQIRDSRMVKRYQLAMSKLAIQPTCLYLTVKHHASQHSRTPWLWKLAEWSSWFLFLILFTFRELSDSLYLDLLRVFLYAFTSTFAVFSARAAASFNGREGQEDSWGFGQLVALLLLALPLLTLLEAIYEGNWNSATSDNNAQYVEQIDVTQIIDTPSPSEAEMYEEEMYDRIWFLPWVGVFWCAFFALVILLTLFLKNGAPI